MALKRIAIVIGIAVAFTLGLLGAIYLSLRSSETRVPDIIGKNRAAAEDTISSAGLNFRVRAMRPTSEAKPDTVLIQLPHAGEIVKVGQTVAVDISRPTKEGETSTTNSNANADADKKQENDNSSNSTNSNNSNNSNTNTNDNKPKKKPVNKNANDNLNGNSNRPANRNANRATNANANGAATPSHNNQNANATPRVNTNRSNSNLNSNRRPPVSAPTP